MKLIYSYSSYLGNQNNQESNLRGYMASMKRAKQLGYYIKFYGCDYSILELREYYDECVTVEEQDFIFTDDLKIWIHSNEDLDCITIDGDIILYDILKIPNNCDVLFERRGKVGPSTKYQKAFSILLPFEINKYISDFSYNDKECLNVGILKFNNIETKKLLIQKYYNIRNYFLKNIYPLHGDELDFSIIFCEYYFKTIIKNKNLDVLYCSEFNEYEHYFFEKKLSEKYKKEVDAILNTNINLI